ncbi:non-hydrolyzing UDP-N-acetylglucosamine 2-epimerase [Oricola thermophila]|uniref:UDP-N-acetylglucosamine 2-epimerase (Non-hydrolyzing) n=1 Tax=Oricola thermophila TaxID=2742145 RepID=A0A6N1VGI5_9HYPH|nr:UDP-N-acetylglucosamine 2-epimerase (non-hydrolyzing) [Oricola thermophila]QKV18775.1 UDP-N-acetylglucosamine 2-epimerase (non-hydrolyzing) [Oricola thermophila]
MSDIKFIDRSDMAKEVAVVVGTRPGIIMMAPVIHALTELGVPNFVIHTGQHYSPAMDSELFEDLRLPKPAFHIEDVAGKKTHAGQTAVMLEGCEAALMERRPRLVLVNGDANTNLAGALAARKLHVGVGHIEAGERSFDWRMPEEHNRRIMDHISELLFASGEKAAAQLRKESVPGEIHVTGNTIVDASLNHANLADRHSDALNRIGLEPGSYILATSHREENVDVPGNLEAILRGIGEAARSADLKALFLAHPRTVKRIEQFGLADLVGPDSGIVMREAIRYLDFIKLLKSARIVMTDSGGVQQEAYIHRRPTVTMRKNTEWTETLETGANRLANPESAQEIREAALAALGADIASWPDIFGDGQAAKKIAMIAKEFVDR